MRTIIVIILFSLGALQCRKSADIRDCNNFRSALESGNIDRIQEFVQPLARQVGEMPPYQNGTVIHEKIKRFISLLNENACDVTADDQYGFIKTNPPLAEIFFRINGSAEPHIIDFRIQEGRLLQVVNIHE